jgi:hypothetical protein
VESRLHKRQTGNDAAYTELVAWWAEYAMDMDRLGGHVQARIAEGILAFPAGDFFWEKVFEIWVVGEVSAALATLGGTLAARRSLGARSAGPVEDWIIRGRNVRVWFQRQLPMGDPHWRYEEGGPFTGIPDVVVAADGLPTLVIDAKYRPGSAESRSEETYKMLGYAENFRKPGAFVGILIFPGSAPQIVRLRGPNEGSIGLVTLDAGERPLASPPLRDLVIEWATELARL